MLLPSLPSALSSCLALGLWLLSTDALGQGLNAHHIDLLGSGGQPLQNDAFESGSPWQEPDEGQPSERLPSWLRDELRAVPEIRELLARIESSDDTSEQLRFELFAAARDLHDALR